MLVAATSPPLIPGTECVSSSRTGSRSPARACAGSFPGRANSVYFAGYLDPSTAVDLSSAPRGYLPGPGREDEDGRAQLCREGPDPHASFRP
jgi:hypothetical protein